MPSPGGFLEAPCIKCGRRDAGVGWGERCSQCQARLKARASRVGRWSALTATVAVGLWIRFTVPANAPYATIYGIVAVVATYIIVRRVVSRIAMEFLD